MMVLDISSAEGLGRTVDGMDETSRQRDQSTVEEQKKKSEPKLMEPKTPPVQVTSHVMSSKLDDNGMHVPGAKPEAYLREHSSHRASVDEFSFQHFPLEHFGGSPDDVVIPCEESLLACGLTAEELADLEMDVFSHEKPVV